MTNGTLEGTQLAEQVVINDESGKVALDHIEGMTVEEYYAAAGLTIGVDGDYTPVSNGVLLNPMDTLQPGATVTTTRMIRNG